MCTQLQGQSKPMDHNPYTFCSCPHSPSHGPKDHSASTWRFGVKPRKRIYSESALYGRVLDFRCVSSSGKFRRTASQREFLSHNLQRMCREGMKKAQQYVQIHSRFFDLLLPLMWRSCTCLESRSNNPSTLHQPSFFFLFWAWVRGVHGRRGSS